ncbi:MAG: hypothetical protein AB1Z98_24760 [Nannocystaceae bacterium]
MMMPRCARSLALLVVGFSLVAGCASLDTPTADPEAQRLDPPVIIIEEPQDADADEPTAQVEASELPAAVAKDPDTEVITFVGADAPPAMADEITAPPKRDPLPSMMSDIIHGPNK